MQVSVEAPSKIERRVTVVVPVEKLDEAFNQRIEKWSKTAKVKGFRPGKVPLEHVRKVYGDTARQEALSEVIQSSLYEAIHQEKLNPVAAPLVEPKNIVPGQPLEFVATFEVLPEVGQVNFDVTTLEKEIATIQDSDIDQVLDRLGEQHIEWKKVERAANQKDQVVIDFTGSVEGVEFQGGKAHDYPIVLGSKTMIPGFEEGIVGLSAGQEKVIQVTFPENYFSKDLAGKAADFAIKVIKVSEPKLPEMNEAFVKKLGIKSGSVDELRSEIRKNLERELERVIKLKLKTKVFDKLIELNALEIPKALIEQEAKRIHDQVHPHHGKEHHHSAQEMEVFNQAAQKNVLLGLLVGELVKQFNLKPSKERIDAEVAQIASSYENPEEVIKYYASNRRQMAEVEMQVLEEAVLEKLLEKVKVTEKTLSYNELVSHRE